MLFLVLFVLTGVSKCYSEVYSSSDDIIPLLATQTKVIRTHENILRELNILSFKLENTISNFKKHAEFAEKDPEKYVGNPINAFTLINRLIRDVEDIDVELHNTLERIKKHLRSNDQLKYPDNDDLLGAVTAMVRLIDTYQLDHYALSQGRIFEAHGLPMTSNECYDFAEKLFENADWEYAAVWLSQAEKNFDIHSRYNLASVYFNIAECQLYLGEFQRALDWYDYILTVLPNNALAVSKRKEIMKKELREQYKYYTPKVKHQESYEYIPGVTYEALCRGEYDPSKKIIDRLKCFYKYGEDPFLNIAPFKVEELHPNISLYIFHDVISDAEINWSIQQAKPKLERSEIISEVTGKGEPATYRVCKVAWLVQHYHSEVAKIYKRVEMMTGLETASAEHFQIVNYGIGGHYEPHFDFKEKSIKLRENEEDKRIATVLFYLSDVEMGGGTVFQDLGVTVMPKKGSALVWRNLHPSGEGNTLTKHAACPVLVGSKWIGSVWIRSENQHFRAPCNLEYQMEESVSYQDLPRPRRKRPSF